jgi:hypothetical protein
LDSLAEFCDCQILRVQTGQGLTCSIAWPRARDCAILAMLPVVELQPSLGLGESLKYLRGTENSNLNQEGSDLVRSKYLQPSECSKDSD